MIEREQHRERWSDDLAAYALGALDERGAALLEHHLSECEACSAELRWLLPAIDAIPASVEQIAPPPELRERLMAVVAEEAAPSPEGAKRARAGRRLRLPWLGSFGLRPSLAAAAVLLLAAGVAGYELRNETSPSQPETRTYAAVSEVAGSHAHGTLEVRGDQGALHVADLPPTGPDEVYQAWVQEPAGSVGRSEVHASSVFVVSEDGTGDVIIPRGLDDAARVMVTREPKGGSKLPSESPVLTAEMG